MTCYKEQYKMSNNKEEQNALFELISNHFDDQTIRSLPEELAHIERNTIGEKLVEFDGNRTKTANALGIGRTNLVAKIKKYELVI